MAREPRAPTGALSELSPARGASPEKHLAPGVGGTPPQRRRVLPVGAPSPETTPDPGLRDVSRYYALEKESTRCRSLVRAADRSTRRLPIGTPSLARHAVSLLAAGKHAVPPGDGPSLPPHSGSREDGRSCPRRPGDRKPSWPPAGGRSSRSSPAPRALETALAAVEAIKPA